MFRKVTSLEEAVDLISDEATIAVGASSGVSLPDKALEALGMGFRLKGRPRDLTVIFPVNLGDMFGQKGLDHLANEGQVRCLIGGSFPSGPSSAATPAIRRLITNDRLRAYNYPIGILMALLGESAAKGLGVLTETGLGTFIDTHYGGGGLNECSRRKPFVRRAKFEEREYLFFPALTIDVAIIRATTADEHGNLTFEHEAALISPFTLAAAAKASRGRVIAQVKRLRATRRMDPRAVKVPGYMVDAVVVAPDQMQATKTTYDPAISGQDWASVDRLPVITEPLERFLSRRIAGEIKRGDTAVIGYGVCANVPTVLAKTGEIEHVNFVIEQGAVGGIPLTGFQFGCAYNAAAYIDARLGFDYLRGGGFDVALLSFLQFDRAGNLNVSALPARPHVTAGIGGFMDIVQNAPRLVFAGQFRGGGADISIDPSGLNVRSEGKHSKFVSEVSEVTVPADVLRRNSRSVRFVTERCTFELRQSGLHLVEIVPGIDPRRDILELCQIPVSIAEPLKVMDRRLFSDDARPLLA
jgi:propionate CoA-transferase